MPADHVATALAALGGADRVRVRAVRAGRRARHAPRLPERRDTGTTPECSHPGTARNVGGTTQVLPIMSETVGALVTLLVFHNVVTQVLLGLVTA